MVLTSTREIELSALQNTRLALAERSSREQEAAVQAVLQAAAADVSVNVREEDGQLRISARLITLDAREFAALSGLLQAQRKGYGAATLTPLLEELAHVFRS